MIVKTNESEIFGIISDESLKFKKIAAKAIFKKKISNIASSVANAVNSEFSSEGLRDIYVKAFDDVTINPKIIKSLEDGGIGNSFAEEIASKINKYVSQEADYRINNLKKHFGVMFKANTDVNRVEAISHIVKSFESSDLHLTLSESLNEEVSHILKSEENEIIDNVSGEVKTAITDGEEKAEVTRMIINEFTEVHEKIKEQQDALKPDVEQVDETIEGCSDSTEHIKSFIPVTTKRLDLELSKNTYTAESMMKFLITLEEITEDFAADKEFIKKRIQSIYNDAVEVKSLDATKVKDFEELFTKAIGNVDGKFSAFRELGFGQGDLPAAKRDGDTLEVIKKMAELKAADDSKRINDCEILAVQKVNPQIAGPDEFLKTSIEAFELNSLPVDKVSNYETHRQAIELREEALSEFMVKGMEHVPEARAKRLKEINSGLRKLNVYDGLNQLKANRLKAIYYKTAKIVDPQVFVDYKSEAERVKNMIKETYNTEKYSEVVDDFFKDSGEANKAYVTEENLYELLAFKGAKEISTESDGYITDESKNKIKKYAGAMSAFVKTLESMDIISKEDIKAFAKKVSKI